MIPKFTYNSLVRSYNASREEGSRRFAAFSRARDLLNEAESNRLNLHNAKTPWEDLPPLDDLDYTRLEHLLDGKFYSPYVMKSFSRILSQIYTPGNNGTPPQLEKVRYWLDNLEQLSSGVFGITLEATLRGMFSPEVVIKFPKVDDLTHEIYTGLYGTNKLRQYIPNFYFVYGGFSCSAPVVLGDQVLDYCNNPQVNSIYDYALFENVQPSQTFFATMANLKEEGFLNLYLQVLLSLQMAYELISFSHYDLHGYNVLIRELEKEVILTYTISGQNYYLVSKYIATIIDYGYSSFLHQGQRHNLPGLSLQLGVGDNQTFPLYDAYRLLAYLYIEAPPTLKPLLRRIVDYFTDLQSPQLDKLIVDSYCALPSDLSGYDLKGLINYLFTLGSVGRINDPSDRSDLSLFSCAEKNCDSLATLSSQIYLSQEKKSNSLLSLYYNYSLTGDRTYLRNYPSFQIAADLRRLRKEVSNYNQLIENIPVFNNGNLRDPASYRRFLYLMQYVAKCRKLELHIAAQKRALSYFSTYYSTVLTSSELARETSTDKLNYSAYISLIYQALQPFSPQNQPYLVLLSQLADYIRTT